MSSNKPIQEAESIVEKPDSDPLISQDSDQESKKSKEKEEGSASPPPPPKSNGTEAEEDQEEDGGSNGRERLKRHRVEVAGRVWIPDMWGQEDLLKDWIDCTAFDASLARATILMARDSLAKDARSPPHSTHLRVQDG